MSDEINFNAPEPEELNELLSGYDIDELIAKGGMGAVYHAVQVSLDREVAIKVLPAEFGDATFRKQFATEAKAMAKLNHHNLIGIFDFGEVNGMPYIVMEYVRGESLYYAAYHRQYEQNEAVRLVIDISHGLGHAHEAGLLHRDIKPANILLNEKQEPKIGDFGLARATAEKGVDEIIYGTPGYAAPEVVNNPSEVGRQSDIFAVGIILHELLTGALPDEHHTPPSQICACDPRLDAVVRKATQADPSQRYESAGELAAELEKIKSSLRKNIFVPQNNSPGGSSSRARPPALGARPGARKTSPPLGTSAAKSGDNAFFLRNLFIIALLLGALGFTWQAYQKKQNRIAEELAEIDRKEEEQLAKKRRQQERDAARNTRSQANNPTPTLPTPTPGKPDKAGQTLAQLKEQLRDGDRSEFPVDSLARDDSHFLFIGNKLTWSQAAVFCEEHGGQLATLADSDAVTWLSRELPGGTLAWLGGAALGSTWKWIDDRPWSLRDPSSSLGNRVAIANTGIVKPREANSPLPFIIEWADDGLNQGSLAEQLQRVRNTRKNKIPAWPPGTIAYENRRYLLVQRPLTWSEAEKMADSSAGKIAVPSDKDENFYLREYLDNALPAGDSCWLGATKRDGAWQWVTGEPWDYADWKSDFPEGNSAATALGYYPGKQGGWVNADPDDPASAFLIEWSEDGRKALPAPQKGSELAELQALATKLVTKASADYSAALRKAADNVIWEADAWLRGLPKSQNEAYAAGLQTLKTKLKKSPLIGKKTLRRDMPEDLAKIVDYYVGKQQDAKDTFTAEMDKLRSAYVKKLRTIKTNFEKDGLTTQANRISREISAVGQTAESFSDYSKR